MIVRGLVIFLILVCLSLSAQKNNTINGYIIDSDSRERLIGANISLQGTSYGTSTNAFGYYSITAPSDTYKMVVSFIGYNDFVDTIALTTDLSADYALSPISEILKEATVIPGEFFQKSGLNHLVLPLPVISDIPALMGEVDIFKALQLLPGVQSGNEGTSGLYVRGGSPDQNLILLDGVPVYNASHLFGFFSVFNADAVKRVSLTKGGFPARFGGRLSSVLEIDMKDGNMREYHGQGALGLISSKLTLEGPIIRDKTSFMISGRRTYYDLLIRPFLPEGVKSGYYFGDLNVKLNHIFNRKNRLFVSYYGGVDEFYFSENQTGAYSSGSNIYRYENNLSQNLEWGNRIASLRWNHIFGNNLFGNLTGIYSTYRFGVEQEEGDKDFGAVPPIEETSGYKYSSKITDYGLKYDLEYSPLTKHRIRGGVNYTYHLFKPGVVQIKQNFDDINVDSLIALSENIHGHEAFAYLEDEWIISSRLRANLGFHYSLYFVNDEFYQSFQPRLSTQFLVSDNLSLTASYAQMTQYIHLLSNSGLGLPTDLWVSATDRIKPQNSSQVSLGGTLGIGGSYEVSSELYYKWMNNLIEYKEGASFLSATDWQNAVESDGIGKAYGIEVLLRKTTGKTTGWLGYTLSRSQRQFSNINQGKTYPYKFDRRHDISLVLNYKINDRVDLGMNWVYGTGNAFTVGIGEYYLAPAYGAAGTPQSYQEYTSRNALRAPAYHRLDFGVNFRKQKRWGERIWNISVYNAYNRSNPFFLYMSKADDSRNRAIRQVSLFPILPTITYKFSF